MLLDNGGVMVKLASPYTLLILDTDPNVGFAFETVMVTLVLAALYEAVAAWLMLIVATPTPTIVTWPVPAFTVATLVFDEL